MSRSIDEIYQSIAKNVFNELKEDWLEANVYVELFDGAGNFKGSYTDSASNIKIFEVYDDALDDFENLQNITTEGGSINWNRAQYTLYPNGKFSIEFEWDQDFLMYEERNQ